MSALQKTRREMRAKPIGLIKTGRTLPTLCRSHGDFEGMFRNLLDGHPVTLVSVFDGEPLPDPEELCGAIITGSPRMVTERSAWMLAIEQWIRERVAETLPLLGVCFGHQLIAQALGGKVTINPAGRQIGTVRVTRNESASDPLFQRLPISFWAQTTHLESVVELPPNAIRLAATQRDSNHAFRYGERTWGVQFHPEFDAQTVNAYLDERKGEIQAEGMDWEALRDTTHDETHGANIVHAFLEHIT